MKSTYRLIERVQRQVLTNPSWTDEKHRHWIAATFGLDAEDSRWCLEPAREKLARWSHRATVRGYRLPGVLDTPSPSWENAVRVLEEGLPPE